MSKKLPEITITPDMERNAAAAALSRTSKATGIGRELYELLAASTIDSDPETKRLAEEILFNGFFPVLRTTHLKILNGDGKEKT